MKKKSREVSKTFKFFVLFFSSTLMFSQEVELKHWTFYSEKDNVKQDIEIPHTFNAIDVLDDEPGYWRGKSFYSTQIIILDTLKTYFLHFNAANQFSKVWINNKLSGQHKGGYTAFDIDISPYLKQGVNEVKVEVDNSHDEKIPPLDADFTFYGGIYRTVFLVEENAIHFKKEYGADAIKIDALLDENWQGKIEVKGAIFNENPSLVKQKVKLTLRNADNKLIETIAVEAKADFKLDLAIKNPLLWSPESPNLYSVELNLFDTDGKLVDTYYHKIGFRKIKATTVGFYINGKPLKLIGVNRHQDLKGYGNAVPAKKQVQDLVMIKEMGGNFLRLAHYPQDKEIYKAADSLGIILWSEIPVVNKVPVDDDSLEYKENAILMQKEHISQNYNHASLVFIGYMNEIFLRMVFDKRENEEKDKIIQKTLDLAQELEKLTRKVAPNHITVMALHGNQIYNETAIANLPMVIGWNLYFGWYEGGIYDLGKFLDEEFRKYPNKPLIISEYGVGTDSRLHNENPEKFDFSEDYQLKYHTGYYKQIMKRPYVVGMSAWNFADFGSEFRGNTIPHINQKGLVDFGRTPKNCYYWYQAMLQPEKKLTRFYRSLALQISDLSQKKIKIISNQNVSLKNNDDKIVELLPDTGIIEYMATLKEGVNNFYAYDTLGNLQDSLRIEYQKPDLNKNEILAINFGSKSHYSDDTAQIWIPFGQQSQLKILGDVKEINSSSNIKDTTDDPIYQSSLTNVKQMEMELPKGYYELTLLFSELKKDKKIAYELNNKKEVDSNIDLNKTVKINNKAIKLEKLSPFMKLDVTTTVYIKDKLHVEALNKNQTFSICGIKIKKIDKKKIP